MIGTKQAQVKKILRVFPRIASDLELSPDALRRAEGGAAIAPEWSNRLPGESQGSGR